MAKDRTHSAIYWFRKGLRLHDNPALLKMCTDDVKTFRPIFILDPWFVKNAKVGLNRWRFLLQSLKDLDMKLKALNSRLYVLRGNPQEVFPRVFKDWGVTRLGYEVDTEPYARERDSLVTQMALQHNIEVVTETSHTLYNPERIIAKNSGNPPLTYQRFQTVLSQIGPPPKPARIPSSEDFMGCLPKFDPDHEEKYGVPTLESLGHDTSGLGPCLYPGGESEALKRLNAVLDKPRWICSFEKPKTEPNSLQPSTTVLSPYLKFGCLSARTFYYKLLEIYQKEKKHTQPPVSLHGQLLWREFFYTVGSTTTNFDKMEGNAISRQIPWDNNPEYLEAWSSARTGYPFIDAIMTQLRKEGWIHHLARHAVACFLTRGDLWISWEEGQKVFEELLLDADWSLNAGNWMWLSASAFFHQYFRVYSPIAFGKKTDKNGDYIKKYLPVLKKFPAQYIYEPWKAPLSVQKAAGCVIGTDYPRPIVDHDVVRERNIKRMAAAYSANKADSGQDVSTSSKKRKGEKSPAKTKKTKITDYTNKKS